MKNALALLLAAGLAGGGIAMATAKDSKPEPEVRNIGAPKSCVNIRNIKSTDVIDRNTIDFKMTGGKIYRNTMPASCPGLTSNDAFSYRVPTSQLCNVDIIHVLENYGGRLHQGAGCGLGKFQQIEKIKAEG